MVVPIHQQPRIARRPLNIQTSTTFKDDADDQPEISAATPHWLDQPPYPYEHPSPLHHHVFSLPDRTALSTKPTTLPPPNHTPSECLPHDAQITIHYYSTHICATWQRLGAKDGSAHHAYKISYAAPENATTASIFADACAEALDHTSSLVIIQTEAAGCWETGVGKVSLHLSL